MKKTAQFQLVDQAFLPAREIEIPELFSGRKEEIVQGLHALRSQGASICIYGKRGVGKSSIAKQLRLVASGYSALTDLIGYPELFDGNLFHLPSVYFYCDDTIKNANDLFRKLLSDRDSLHGICRYNDGIILRKTKTKKTAAAKLTLRILEAFETEELETENVIAELDPVSAFKSVTSEIVDSADSNGIVIVIDEFERVSNKIGIASIIKTCPHVKFILVGIADDVRSLITDHESIRRQLAEGIVRINPMMDEMLIEILKRAEAILKDIKFEEEVIAKIVGLSDGYPHWVHLLGKWSCIDVIEHDGDTVGMENFHRAMERIVKNEPTYEDTYMEITQGKQDNELMLKILVLEKDDKFNPEEKYKIVERHDVTYVSWQEYIQYLIGKNILSRVEHRFTGFRDTRFKVYSKIRPPLYPENSIKNISGESDFYNIAYTAKGYELPNTISAYLTDYTFDSYTKVSQFVPVDTPWYSQWRETEDKPILYDSKDKPILYDSKGKSILYDSKLKPIKTIL
jgi:Cdc6-like AAA superfamily ATPase